ncbi:MAG TPA: glycosyltransferase 87 family protein [Acidimicrobiales bacterium]
MTAGFPAPPVEPDVTALPWAPRRHLALAGRAVLEVLPAWVVARILVAGALVVAHLSVRSVRPGNPTALQRVHDGLLGWDAGWYRAIGDHGYVAAGRQALRFFPLYPVLGRGLGHVPGLGIGPALVVVANVASLLAMAGLVLLVRHDQGDIHRGGDALARRSVWLLALAPSAYALTLAYADAVLLLCVVVVFLGIRTDRWWWAAAAGLAAGAVRPVGVLLLVPVAVELWSRRHQLSGVRPWGAGVATLVAPVVGVGAYLAWVGHVFHDVWLPFTVQQQSGHRGRLAAPFDAMWHDSVDALHGHHLGSALHIPWVLVCVALAVVAWRRLPRSYAAFSVAVLVVSLSSANLDSFERYALGAFPLVVAASTCTSRRPVELVVLVASGAAMAGYATLAFLGIVVP